MRNFLFYLRTRTLLVVGLASAVVVETMEFHATAECQIRPEIVSHRLPHTAKLIALQQNRVIEYAQQFLDSLTWVQNRAIKTLFGCQRSARACDQRIISPVPASWHEVAFDGV